MILSPDAIRRDCGLLNGSLHVGREDLFSKNKEQRRERISLSNSPERSKIPRIFSINSQSVPNITDVAVYQVHGLVTKTKHFHSPE